MGRYWEAVLKCGCDGAFVLVQSDVVPAAGVNAPIQLAK